MAIALSVTIASQVSNGLGEDVTRLGAGQLQKFYLVRRLTLPHEANLMYTRRRTSRLYSTS